MKAKITILFLLLLTSVFASQMYVVGEVFTSTT